MKNKLTREVYTRTAYQKCGFVLDPPMITDLFVVHHGGTARRLENHELEECVFAALCDELVFGEKFSESRALEAILHEPGGEELCEKTRERLLPLVKALRDQNWRPRRKMPKDVVENLKRGASKEK